MIVINTVNTSLVGLAWVGFTVIYICLTVLTSESRKTMTLVTVDAIVKSLVQSIKLNAQPGPINAIVSPDKMTTLRTLYK